MSSISIDKLLPVTAGAVNTGFTAVTLAGLFATENALIPNNNTQRVLRFTSATQVGDFFGLESEEYDVAVQYFKSYDGSLNIPPFCLFARYIDEDIAPYIRGGANPSLTTLQDITSGTITFEFNGSSYAALGAPVATGTSPLDSATWTDGTDSFVTVISTNLASAQTILTYKLISGVWTTQGVGLGTGTGTNSITAFTVGSNRYVAVTNTGDDTVGVYLWSGTAFALVGSAVAVGEAPNSITSFKIAGSQYIAITCEVDETVEVYLWTGSTLTLVGTPLSVGTSPTGITSFLIGTTNYLVALNNGDDTFNLMVWGGSSFGLLGAPIATGTAPTDAVAYDIGENKYLSVTNSTDDTISTYLWSGTVFSSIGAAVATGTTPTGIVHTKNSGISYLTVTNAGDDNIETFKWNGTSWLSVSTIPAGTTPQAITSIDVNGVNHLIVLNFAGNTLSPYFWTISATILTGIDLSTATSLSQVAAIIQAALIAAGLSSATCTYDTTTLAFTVSNGDTSGEGTVNYCPVSDLATAMKLTQATGAVLSQGSLALSPAENMNSYVNVTRNWASFTTIFEPTTEQMLAFTEWVNGQQYQFAYVLYSTEGNLIIPGNTSTIAQALVDAGFGTKSDGQITYSAPIYPNYGLVDLAAAIMGTMASIDYREVNGVISFAYKSYSGIVPLVDTNVSYDTLLQNGFNFYGIFDARATTYNFTQNGAVGGIFKWFDFLANQIWLADQIQNSIAVFFRAAKQVPNNEIGYQQITSIINGVAQDAILNGVITPGNTFDAATSAVLKQQAGYDISSFLTENGWYLQIIPVDPSQRVLRQPPTTTFWYSNAGSIVTLPITTVLVF